MPELPEVETIRIGLSKLLPGKKVAAVWHDWDKSFPNAEEDVKGFLIGAKILEVKRRAKVLLVELDSKHSLVIHLKMTGQLVYIRKLESPVTSHESQVNSGNKRLATSDSVPLREERFGAGHPSDSLVSDLPVKSTHVIIDFTDNSKLFFNDQRKFGWVRLMPTTEVSNIDFFKKVGPEPLSADFKPEEFRERVRRRKNSNIKAVLLDQAVLAGVGNIYADESLWAAKIHPQTLVKDLSDQKLNSLFREVRSILQLSIDKGGSSDRNYVDAEGRKGSYLSFAKVFRREGKPCARCGTTIIKTRVASRGTHLCPNCQRIKE